MRYFIFILLVFTLAFLILGVGRYELSYTQILTLFFNELFEADLNLNLNEISSKDAFILFEVRLPRVILAMVVGAGLGVAGASFQAIFKNPLAS